MRPLPLVIGVCATLAIALGIYGAVRHLGSEPVIVVERGALQVPSPADETITPTSHAALPVSEPASASEPYRPQGPGLARPSRVDRAGSWSIGPDVPFLPPVQAPPLVQPNSPTPRVNVPPVKRTPQAPDGTAAASPSTTAPDQDLQNTCVECDERAEKYVRRLGRLLGFCVRHSSPELTGGAAPREPHHATAPHDEPTAQTSPAAPIPAAPPSGTITTSQCRGATRTGARCRRKTRDTSGYCPQHRGQAAPN